MFTRRALIAGIALGTIIVAVPAYPQDKSIVVASTTSTQDSGLYEYLVSYFASRNASTIGTSQDVRDFTCMWSVPGSTASCA